jgi:glycosyltransferase involved in cell wall biosynthesis
LYQREALRHVKKSTARIYHCRAGYGGRTIEVAREKGMVIVVDHSIPHPCALVQLVEQGGYYEPGRKVALPPMWEIVLEDIERADYVLANSDYAKKTLVDYSIDPDRVPVLYWGLDPQFETLLATGITDTVRSTNGDIRFLFAGGVNKRKGADILL